MGLVLSLTFIISALSLAIMYLAYFSRTEILRNMAKVIVISYIAFYSSVWLSSHDDTNLKIESSHTFTYRVFKSKEELMMAYYGVKGSPSESDEVDCFFYSVNGKVVSVPLKMFRLSDYTYITPLTRFVIEDYTLVGKHPYYFKVSIPKHKEYLETVDYTIGSKNRIYFKDIN